MQVPHTEAAPAPETRATAPKPGNGAGRVDSGGKRLRRRRNRFAWWLIAPAITFRLLVHVLPTLAGLYVSFLRLNTFTLPQLFAAPWNGLQNYKDLFSSTSPLHDGFFQAARNTVEYTTLVVVGTVGGGLGVALLLNRTFPGRRLVRTLMLLPWVVPSFVAATLFQFMLQRNAGIVNKILVDYTDVLMTLIVRQSFDNSLFGLGAAISTLLMLAMCVWVLIWYRAFRRDFEVAPA